MLQYRPEAYIERQPGDPVDRDRLDPADPEPVVTAPELLAADLAEQEAARQEGRLPDRMGGLLTPRRPGFTGTVTDWEKAFEVIHEQTRRHYSDWTAAAVLAKATEQYERLGKLQHPKLPEQYAELMPVSWAPRRDHLRSDLEVKAIRQLPEWRTVEDTLGQRPPGAGRPTDRTLPVAAMSMMALQDGAPMIRGCVNSFTGSNLLHDWAFFDSADMEVNRAVMRDETAVRKQIHAMTGRHDASIIMTANAHCIERLHRYHPLLGTHLVVDGTPVPAWVEDAWPVSDFYKELQVRRTGAEKNHHGEQRDQDGNIVKRGKSWMGNVLLVVCCMLTGLPLMWVLLPRGPEYPWVLALLAELKRLMPFLRPQTITGDKEYDRSGRLALELHALMDIAPIFPLRNQMAARFEHRATQGTPVCGHRGHGLMTFEQNDSKEWRPEIDATPGTLSMAALERHMRRAKTRWYCAQCREVGRNTRENTYAYKNPRLYCFLPRMGSDWRVAARIAHLLHRNCIEQLFSQIKRRGIASTGHQNCRWATEKQDLEWLIGMALLGVTARRLAHESGLYDEAADAAWDLNLLKFPAPHSAHALAA